MRVTIEFKLPEEEEEFMVAAKATNLYFVLLGIDDYLRSQLKYTEMSEAEEERLEKVRDKLYEYMGDRDVSLDMMS